MALKPCKVCGKETTTYVDICRHCGAKNPTNGERKQEKKYGIGYAIFVVMMGLLILYALRHRAPTPSVHRHVEQNQQGRKNPERNLTYKVVDEVLSDKPFRTLIEKYIVVSGVPTESELESKLNRTYQAILADAKTRDYYHQVPDVFLYIYGTKEQAEAGNLWIGMLAKTTLDETIDLRISESRLAALSQPHEQRLGFSEQKRKDIYRAVESAMYRAQCDAVDRIPSWLSRDRLNTRENINRQLDLEVKLSNKYEDDIRRTYGISENDLTEIMTEAAHKGWPPPPLPDCIDSPKATNSGW